MVANATAWLTFFTVVATFAVCVDGLASNTNTGVVVLSASYGTDSTCASYSLTSVSYTPVGVCYPTSSSASVIFSTDGGINVFADVWRSSATCSGKADDVSLQITGASNAYVPLTCTLSLGSYISTFYYASSATVAAAASPVGSLQSTALYRSATCAGAPYSTTLTPTNPTGTAPTTCTAAACAAYNGGAYVTSSAVTSCVVASATTAATVVATGYAYTALYAGKTCALNQVPSSVDEFVVNTCTPYAAATGATYGGVAALGYARQVYSYQIGVANGAAVFLRVHAEGYFSDAACAGTLLYAVSYVISGTAPACTSDGTNQIVWYSTVPFSKVPSTVWPAFGTSSTSLSTLSGAQYKAVSYWWSQSTCEAPGGANVPPYVKYSFPLGVTSCSAIGAGDIVTYPALSFAPACNPALGTATNSNGFAIISFYNNPTCSGSPVAIESIQQNVCWLSSLTTSCAVIPNPAGISGNPPFTVVTYDGLTCTGAVTITRPLGISCAPALNPARKGLYTTVMLSQTATQATTSTGQPLALNYFAGYNSQADCNAGATSSVIFVGGDSPSCVSYPVAAPTPTSYVTSTVTTTSCPSSSSAAAPAGGATSPTTAPVAGASPNPFGPPKFPTAAPSVSFTPTGPPTAPACFAATERVTLEDGATKAMADVVVGDRILTVSAQTGAHVYSAVVAVPHGKNAEKTTFAVVTTASGRDVKMTANHMLPAGACETPAALPFVSASSVSVGECVETVSGRERVVSVSTVEGRGIYTVVAMEELLVVNGVVATPYGGVNPALANAYYNLHRLAYSVAGPAAVIIKHLVPTGWWATALALAST